MSCILNIFFCGPDMGGGALSRKYSNPLIHVLLLYELLLFQVCKLIWGAHILHTRSPWLLHFYGGA